MFSIGCASLSLSAYLLPDWRELVILLSGLGLFLLPFLWFIPESPRWDYLHGRIENCYRTLSKFGGEKSAQLLEPTEVRKVDPVKVTVTKVFQVFATVLTTDL